VAKEDLNLKFDALILGAGAAGLMCAAQASRHGARVAILERSEKPGKKILISGGGRCNFTNLRCVPQNFLSDNPDFCRSALARFTPDDFLELVTKHQIPYHEKMPYPEAAEGQLFCDRSSADILNMLQEEGAASIVFLNANVTDVFHDGGFRVRVRIGSAEAAEFWSKVLVVATGGLSIPKMGATGLGYEIARQFGHSIVACRPGLVPLEFSRADSKSFADLAGVSTLVTAQCGDAQFREKMLFTHRGLTGPVILQASSYWNWKNRDAVSIDLAPGVEWTNPLRTGGGRRDLAAARTALRKILPQRFADRWIERHEPPDWTNSSLKLLEDHLHNWKFRPARSEGYEKAEVTAGGVNTRELSSKSMESQKVPGLHFIGEVVDVTGWLGGYNFQWAWASAVAAGKEIGSRTGK
jgi:predicted Rossmann fold flavoprotein